MIDKINRTLKKNPQTIHYLLLVIAAMISFIIPLFKINETFIVHDWGYFNGLSHVVRSSVLHYKTFPIHNPWVLGGMDILSNPQSRVFSPLILFDLLFNAPSANLLSLLLLATVGVFGFYRLIVFLGLPKNIALIGSVIFINASWFSLHFSEGHIIFGSFQLLGMALYIILRIQEKNFKIYFTLLNVFYLLNGAIYTFIFTNLLLVCCILFQIHKLRIKTFFSSLVEQWKTVLISAFLFISLSAAKLVPLLLMHSHRQPIQEFVTLDYKLLLKAFFDPFQHLSIDISEYGLPFFFHEVGAYFGILGTAITILFLIFNPKKLYLKLVLVGFVFFWIGSGWIASINPWLVFQKIPILNNAHVQPRLFILSFLVFVILLCFGLNFLKAKVNPFIFRFLILFLIAESVFVSTYPFWKSYQSEDEVYESKVFDNLITSNTIEGTDFKASQSWGLDFLHYFNKNRGAKHSNEYATSGGGNFIK